jgi:hypothetical protein
MQEIFSSFKITVHPQIMVSLRKVNWDSLSRISANLPKTRTNPLGTTVLYSNQSQTNLLLKMAAASTFYFVEPGYKFCSLGKLNSAVGAQNGQKQSILFYYLVIS